MFQYRTTHFVLKNFGVGRLPVQSSDLKYIQYKAFVENRSLFISTPGDLPNPGIEPMSLTSPALVGGFFTTSAAWEAQGCLISGKVLKKIIHQA